MGRRVQVFFYGLFMDAGVLREAGVVAADGRRGVVEGFGLKIGRRATLVADAGERAYGVVMSLTHDDLERLYGAPGLEAYRPEAVLARTLAGEAVAALCYNLREAPRPEERNPDYAARLQRVLRGLDFPAEYVASVV